MAVIAELPVAFQLSQAVSGDWKSAVLDTWARTEDGAELARAFELASMPRPTVEVDQPPGYVPSASRHWKSDAATPLGRDCCPHQVWHAPSRHTEPELQSLFVQQPLAAMHALPQARKPVAQLQVCELAPQVALAPQSPSPQHVPFDAMHSFEPGHLRKPPAQPHVCVDDEHAPLPPHSLSPQHVPLDAMHSFDPLHLR
ncbi:MAG TPA: hypothetical protein VJV78_49620 [Polyangiales bacterium]|nr:hypothetical protein [Polyangiales bacterium]